MSPRAAAAKDAGMSEHQAKEVMRVAAVSMDDFERQVNGSTPPSVAILAKQGTRKRSLPTAPAASTHRAKADSIGAGAVARALEKWQADISPAQQNKIEVNTRERKAFVNAIERLPPEMRRGRPILRPTSEKEACTIEKAAGSLQQHDEVRNVSGDDNAT